MSMTVPCPTAEDGDVVHRYVAGTLPADELEQFEIHLLECAACLRAVREGAAVRAALLREGAARSRWRALAWTVSLAAAAVALWILLPSEGAIQRLGRVDQVPGFTGLPVRSGTDSIALLADEGMIAYQDGDYGRAAELLAAVARVDTGPAISFFLGLARLKSGSPEGAVTSLAAALEPADNPYAAEARFYLAKSWLRLGNADSALAHLAAVPPSAGEVYRQASALVDSVQQMLR